MSVIRLYLSQFDANFFAVSIEFDPFQKDVSKLRNIPIDISVDLAR